MKVFGEVERGPTNNRLDFGGDPNPELLNGFIYNCDSYRERRIQRENPRQRFELSECFLEQEEQQEEQRGNGLRPNRTMPLKT